VLAIFSLKLRRLQKRQAKQQKSGPLGSLRKSTLLPTKKEGRVDQRGNLEKDRSRDVYNIIYVSDRREKVNQTED
jgi:hypothetical protein